ncbi:tumor necrosis factor receptor superfamily member 6B-like [Centropristis striata]|uniref:tumor necrosis factor receptor superfamily member 6B-like n=1 Tax=Centropristis striata TaxID=184440 RepID=UPI0027E11B61|nr:tumor necrosis factor receptor superfamily member 6B-like [Centropristis striata]
MTPVSLSFLPLLLLLLLLCFHAAPLHGAASPLTFTDTDPVTGLSVVCDRCAPGFFLRSRCTATRKSECAPCPQGSFTELWNYIGKCLRCGVCGQNQVVKTECSADANCRCECRAGFFYRKDFDMCLPHSECHSGQEAHSKGTPEQDTVCRTCLNDTFSDSVSTHKTCKPHKSCSAAGEKLVLKGFTWHDSICTTCTQLHTTDGGDYLKEILPAFLVHQKMTPRRLRRILHNLPSKNGKIHGISKLSRPDLHARINAWVASATAAQIRQLPDLMTNSGAISAGEKLRHKLQRIDLNLQGLCDPNPSPSPNPNSNPNLSHKEVSVLISG